MAEVFFLSMQYVFFKLNVMMELNMIYRNAVRMLTFGLKARVLGSLGSTTEG